MTCGIYHLKFVGDTSNGYIGQSTNIEIRFQQHIGKLKRDTHDNKKIYAAYKAYGLPKLEILTECDPHELDILESEAISVYNSVNNGLNNIEGQTVRLFGEQHGKCKFSNEQIIKVAKLIITKKYTQQQIADITNTSKTLVKDISSQRCHSWIADIYPEIWRKIADNKGKKLEKQYNIPIKSPEGIIYTSFTNLNAFCREHGLHPGGFFKFLTKDNHKLYKGWVKV